MYVPAMIGRPEGPLPLPPLVALRAFEAAARLSSFTRAAEELCVTQTAISHQVRLLEETLGQALFVRRPRQIALTDHGRAWAAALGDVFARLYAANRSLRTTRQAARPAVAVSVLPSFASRWLVPRLGRFLEQHPHVDLRISPSAELVDLDASELDLGIRYGRGRYPGLKVQKLCGDAWVVVCSPQLAARERLRGAADLHGFTLLHDDNEGWREWLRARGAREIDARRGPLLTDSGMVVEAAVQGQGVGLVRLSLAADELALGRLILPFPRIAPLPTKMSYYLAWSRVRTLRPEVEAFCTWLRAEAASLRALGL
jgi:LysR family transcriptional regulator, glycine cleavage system transcriptional activator